MKIRFLPISWFIAINLVLLLLHVLGVTVSARSSSNNSIWRTEQKVRKKVENGEYVDVKGKELSASFIAGLLTDNRGNIPTYGVLISNAVISGDLDLKNAEISHETRLENCTFTGKLNLYQTKFQKSLSITGSTFEHSVTFLMARVAGYLWADNIQVKKAEGEEVTFESLHVEGSFTMSKAVFERGANFFRLKVGKDLYADEIEFLNPDEKVNFDGISVGGTAGFNKSRFAGPFDMPNSSIDQMEFTDGRFKGSVGFYNTKVSRNANFGSAIFDSTSNFENIEVKGDLDLTYAQFTNPGMVISFSNTKIFGNALFVSTLFQGGFTLIKMNVEGNLNFISARAEKIGAQKSFAGLKADTILFGQTKIARPYDLFGTSYRLIEAESEAALRSIMDDSTYSADTYNNLEAYYRRMGYPDVADSVYIAGKNKERSELLRRVTFWSVFGYVSNSFFYITTGYGKHPSITLLWSLLVIFIGVLFFRKEEYMRIQKAEDERHYEGRYHPVWYSIALFLPVVQLEDSKIWTPKRSRRKSRFYMRIHIILGYLLIPIGLAAWTGLIK